MGALEFDPQVLAALAPLLDAQAEAGAPPPVGDVAGRRASSRVTFAALAAGRPEVRGIDVTEYALPREHGGTVGMTWYRRADAEQPGSAALYLHGGGMILSLAETRELYDSAVRGYVAGSGVPMLMVDYRVAPEFPHPTPVEDCYAALGWLAEHATELGVDADRIAVMGDSAGGGLAAGVALLARSRGGPRIAEQLLIYPMLDDRTTVADPRLEPFLTWTYDDNVTGWAALLGELAGTERVPAAAAPAREPELAGLPSSYLEVGELDVFRHEVITYADRLADAGVSVELHVYPGAPHASDALAPNAESSRRAISDRLRRLHAL
jgi:acetyl esterase/lipase